VVGASLAFVGRPLPALAALVLRSQGVRGRVRPATAGRGRAGGCLPRRAPLLHRDGPNGLRRGRLGAAAGAEGGKEGQMGRPSAGAGGVLPAGLLRFIEFGLPPVLFLLLTASVVSDPASSPEAVAFLTAACAGMMSECVTFPMDALKASMQLRGAAQNGASKPILPMQERIGLLYYGLRAALCRTIPYTGMRMMIYGVFKSALSPADGVAHSALVLTAMAVTAGISAQLLVSPMDLFKIRMQGDATRVRRGERPVYSSLWQLMSSVAREEGAKGMWTGCKINAVRAALMNVADQACTDMVRRAMGPGIVAQLAVSAVTGFTVVLLACPADTVRSKLMNFGPSSPQPQFTGIWDTVTKTWRQSGLRGFYSAIVPMYLREGPYYFVLWNALSGLRHMRGVAMGG
jgi:hypothetical protein